MAPGTYDASILIGETQVYAVDLAWGQLLGAGRDEHRSLRATTLPPRS